MYVAYVQTAVYGWLAHIIQRLVFSLAPTHSDMHLTNFSLLSLYFYRHIASDTKQCCRVLENVIGVFYDELMLPGNHGLLSLSSIKLGRVGGSIFLRMVTLH